MNKLTSIATVLAAGAAVDELMVEAITEWFASFEPDDTYEVEPKRGFVQSDGDTIIRRLTIDGAVVGSYDSGMGEDLNEDIYTLEYSELAPEELRWALTELEKEND